MYDSYLSEDAKREIARFAREQAAGHLEMAELSYFEQLGRRGSAYKDRMMGKLARFKLTGDRTCEAQQDLAAYMSDYVADLMAAGMGEAEAMQKAKETLAADSGSPEMDDLTARFTQHYMNLDPALYEAIGLYYGAYVVGGGAIGAMAGAAFGAVALAAAPIWVPAAIAAGGGAVIGVAGGMLKHASMVQQDRKR